MNKFEFYEAGKPTPVYFEQIYAEKPGGGIVPAVGYDIQPTTALGFGSNGKLAPIKAYRLAAAVVSGDTTIKVEKGSGVAKGDVIAHGKKAVACTAVSTTNPDYDTVTVSLGVAISKGTVLYQAKEASADAAEPALKPVYVAGAPVISTDGEQAIRLINGANLRKETAHISDEVAALLPTITLV